METPKKFPIFEETEFFIFGKTETVKRIFGFLEMELCYISGNEKLKNFSHFKKSKEPTLRGALSGLRQLLATESPLKRIKNAFYFTSKALLVLKIFKIF